MDDLLKFFTHRHFKGFLLLVLVGLWSLEGVGQNLYISGSNSHSVAICANGNVLAWGKNNLGQLGYGVSGNSNIPQVVDPLRKYLVGVKQVDAGSGSHTLALACDNTVYSWGNNEYGQLGNNSFGGFETIPQHVLKGQTPSSSNFLENVKYVSGGNDESYAILANGELVTWGQNDQGQGGNGTTSPYNLTPVYVLKDQAFGGGRLTKIIQVEGGDQTGYALDSEGTVWAWGGNTANNELGRPGSSYAYARPVMISATQQLSNIKQLSGGDTHGLAMDGDGYVWSWGGDWGPGQLGQGLGYQTTNIYAARVVAPGTCTNDQFKTGPFLKVLNAPGSIAAGQAHSMAVLPDGTMVTWGANGFYNFPPNITGQSNPAGQLGQNTTQAGTTPTGTECPKFVVSPSGTGMLSNIVSVSDGDAWSFAVSASGDIYVFGWNGEGELGIGNNNNQNVPQKLDLKQYGCDFAVPCPKANLGADTIRLCPKFANRQLFAGVDNSQYEYTWYLNDTASTILQPAKKGIGTSGGAYYTANKFGKYIVKIRNIQASCSPCAISLDTVVIDSITPPRVPTATYCKNIITPDYSKFKGKYFVWGTDQDSTVGTWLAGKGINPTTIPFNPPVLQPIGNDNGKPIYKIYAFDKTTTYTTAGPKQKPSCTIKSTNTDQTVQSFTVFHSFTLDTLSFRIQLYNNNLTTGNVAIYTQNPIGASSPVSPVKKIPFSIMAAQANTVFEFTIPVNYTFPNPVSGGDNYWIGFTDISGKFDIYTGTCVSPSELIDGAPTNGQLVSINGGNYNGSLSDEFKSGEFGALYNWKLSTTSLYPCGGIEVDVKENCPPCQKPASFKLNNYADSICAVPATNTMKVFVKDTLDNPGTPGPFLYQWYRADKWGAATTPIAGQNKNTLNVNTTLGSGKYVVRVGHASITDPQCYITDSVDLRFDIPFTNNTITPFDTICLGSPAKIKLGSTPSTGAVDPKTGKAVQPIFTWTSSSTPSGTYVALTTNAKGINFDPGTPSADGLTYYRREISGGSCAKSISDSAALLVIQTPNPGAILDDQQICQNSIPLLKNNPASPYTPGAMLSWVYSTVSKKGPWTAIPNSNTPDLNSPQPATGTIYYKRAATVGKCSDTTGVKTVTTVPGMNPGTISADQSICNGIAPTALTSTTPSGGTPTSPVYAYQWFSSTDKNTFTPITTNGISADYTPAALTSTTYYYRQVVATPATSSCDTAKTNIITITVYPKLLGGSIKSGDTSICENNFVRIPSLTPASGGKGGTYVYRWEISTNSGSTWVPAPNTKDTIGFNTGKLTATTWFRRVVEGTPCDTALSNIYKVNVGTIKKPQFTIIDPGVLCSFSPITVRATASDTGSAPVYTWKLSSETLSHDTTAPAYNRVWPEGTVTLSLTVKAGPGCYSSDTKSISFIVKPGMTPGTTDTLVNLCSGDADKKIQSTSAAVGGTGSGIVYQWQESTTGNDPWADIAGASLLDYTPQNTLAGQNRYFRRRAANGNSKCDTNYTKVVVYTRSSQIIGGKIQAPVPAAICGNDKLGIFSSIQDPQNGTPNDLSRFTITWYRYSNKSKTPVAVSGPGDGVTYTPTNTLPVSKDTITYFFYREAKEKCGKQNSDTVSITVLPVLVPEIGLDDPGQTCKLDRITIKTRTKNGGNNPAYTWILNGDTVKNQTGPTFTNTQDWELNSVIKVILTPSNDICSTSPADSILTLNIQGTVTPRVELQVPATTLCERTPAAPVTFTAVPKDGQGSAPTFKFYITHKDNTTDTVQAFSAAATFIANSLLDGDIVGVIMRSNSNCKDRLDSDPSTKQMTLIPLPDAVIVPPAPSCKDITLALVNQGTAQTTYQWLKDGQLLSGQNLSTYVQKDSGSYVYQVVMSNTVNGVSCRDTSESVTTYLEFLQVSAGEDKETDYGIPVMLDATQYPSSYKIMWTPNEQSGDTTLQYPEDLHPVVNPPVSTTYTIHLYSSKTSCEVSDEVWVRVYLPIHVYNVFSPNNDGLNETWFIDGIDSYPENVVRVFNRWGTVVYEKAGYTNAAGWNGTTNGGEKLPVAVYYYVVDPKNAKGGPPQTGYVTILK